MEPELLLVLRLAGLLVILLLSSAQSEIMCPSPRFPTVDVECKREGKTLPCETSQAPGTKAFFKCKPLHHFLFDYRPPSGYESECQEDGEWSVRPFKCVPVCGQPTGIPQALVRNGDRITSATEYPWHVTVYQKKTTGIQQICGGSLITAKYFVSAAHCFFHDGRLLAADRFEAAAGKTQRDWQAEEEHAQHSQIYQIHVKNYGDKRLHYTNDIALVELDEELEVNAYVLPVCMDWGLEEPKLQQGDIGTVIGYGEDVASPSSFLRFGKLPFIEVETCRKNVSSSLTVFTYLPDKFCVGSVAGVTVAHGDSGGGLAFPTEQRKWFLRGVVSVGSVREITYSLFTNVTYFIPWMASIIQKGKVSGRRCGVDVSDSEVIHGSKLDANDFPWEVGVYHSVSSNREFRLMWSGVLVGPELVLTSAKGRGVDISELPLPWLRVASGIYNNTLNMDETPLNVVKVRRIQAPLDVLERTGDFLNFVLLELEAPLNLMPACIDWTGHAFLQSIGHGTTILYKIKNRSFRSWYRMPIMTPTECIEKKNLTDVQDYEFCVAANGPIFEDEGLSGFLMVMVENTWYLRGSASHMSVIDSEHVFAFTDYGNKQVQQWLSSNRDVIGKPTCGKVELCKDLTSGQTLEGHLPWNVGVTLQGVKSAVITAGVLVHAKAVLADLGQLVHDSKRQQNGSMITLSTSSVKVTWAAENGTSYYTNIVKLNVFESNIFEGGEYTRNVVLFELASEIDAMPICLDLTGLVLQPLERGQTSVVEAWSTWTSNHSLVGMPYISRIECLNSLAHYLKSTAEIGTGKFCSGPVQDEVLNGAAVVMKPGNYWYLSGLSSGLLKRRPPYIIRSTDLRDGNLRSWISKTLAKIPTGKVYKLGFSVCRLTLGWHEARDIIRNAVHASEHDVVIFAGSGCTGAVHKLIQAMAITEPPIVFVGPCEHHSNLLPWREVGAQIVRIAETPEGFLDLQDLEQQLQASQGNGRQLIGCFSAASNITGIITDDIATTLLLHQYNALAFWDYATAAPYVKMDMNPKIPGIDDFSVHKDAIFFSMHKFIGGVQTPGILVAKKSLFRNTVPNGCGGGTVFFVSQNGHRYLKDTEMREEGGTGAVVESIRAGMVMQLKEALGVPNIMAREEKISKMVLAHIRTIPELLLLGNNCASLQRLPVFSFMVRHPRGTFLHHNFVCAILNDVFGIQARGGCACAGPYAQDLMGINEDLAAEYETILMEDSRLDRTHLRRREEHSSFEMLRPGFARVSLPYFMSDSEIAFVLEAIKMVATEGWKLLPQYILNPETGEWRHHTNTVFRDRKWLGSIRYSDGKMQTSERRVSGQAPCPQDTGDCLHTARNIFNKARKMAQRYPLPDQRLMFDDRSDALRWFMLPSEAQDLLLGNSQNVKQEVPFDPAPYSGARGRTSSCDSISSGEFGPTGLPLNPNALARHNSLSSIETLPRLATSVPVRARINSLQAPHQRPNSLNLNSLSPLRFCIGDRVHANSSPLTINCAPFNSLARMRCNSVGSSLSCADPNAPLFAASNQSNGSCGSQTDINSIDGDYLSLPLYSVQSPLDNSNPSTSSPQSDGIHAYVQEMTKELATEIKSEIREVISQVEDVLSDATELSSSCSSVDRLQNSSRMRCDSVSAEHVAEYLADKAKDLVSEMKTEIRGMVDGLMSPDRSPLLSPIVKGVPKRLDLKTVKYSISDPSPDKTVSEDSSEETVVQLMGAVNVGKVKDDSEGDDGDLDMTDSLNDGTRQVILDEVKTMDTRVNSISSQDSGINMLCSESDSKGGGKSRKKSGNDCAMGRKKSACKKEDPKETNSEDDSDATKPECSPCTSESDNDAKSVDHCFSCTKNSGCGKTRLPVKKSSVICVKDMNSVQPLVDKPEQDWSATRKRSVCTNSSGSAFTCPKNDDDVVKKACAFRRTSRSGAVESDNVKKSASTERIRSKGGWHCPPKNIWKPTMEAVEEFSMIRDGDRVMVCLSGGKDSLSLLHTLRQYQFYARTKGINFTLGAATVDPGSTAYDPKPLIPYLASLGVHYMYEEQPILEQAANLENGCSSVCSFCSRMKRGRLYAAARANGYNVLALGQHLDDLAESFLMSTFHNGRLRTMKAHYYIKERDLRVIRPFVYVREKALRQFAESRGLPIIPENCPACFEAPKERHRTKQLLAQQEILFPRIFWSLRSALHPLLSFRYTGEEGTVYSKGQRRSSSGVDPPGPVPPEGSDTEEEPIS